MRMFMQVNRIYITLGFSCNMNCQYCMQGQYQKDLSASWEINYKALDKIAEYGTLSLVFFGGEPLVYTDKMLKIISYLVAKTDKINFSVITNGKLLTVPLAEKLNAYNVAVTISHDGYAQQYRGYDPLVQNLDAILAIKNRGFSTVISAVNPDIRETWRFFDEFSANISGRKENVHFEFMQNIDGLTPKEFLLCKETGKAFEAALDGTFEQIYTDLIQENFTGHSMDFVYAWLKGVSWRIQQDEYIPPCGVTHSVCNIDIQGNLYICHSSQIQHGTIEEHGIIPAPKTLTHISTFCKGCPVLKFCGGGCILNKPETKHFDCYPKFKIWLKFLMLLEKIQKNPKLVSKLLEFNNNEGERTVC